MPRRNFKPNSARLKGTEEMYRCTIEIMKNAIPADQNVKIVNTTYVIKKRQDRTVVIKQTTVHRRRIIDCSPKHISKRIDDIIALRKDLGYKPFFHDSLGDIPLDWNAAEIILHDEERSKSIIWKK